MKFPDVLARTGTQTNFRKNTQYENITYPHTREVLIEALAIRVPCKIRQVA